MRRFTPVNNLAKSLSLLAAVIIVLLPFHAFLTVWLSSLVGHYTLLRLWKEFLLVPLVLGALYLLFKNRELRQRYFGLWAVRLILIYALLLLICAVIARTNHAVDAKAMWYGLLVDLRFLVFFLAVLAIASRFDWLSINWRKILLAPAIIVAAFAILQYLVLPYDFLKHFGYGDSTISPYETINHNLSHIRVASTLRGANPLGAYLILPVAVLAAALMRERRQRRNILILGAGFLLALVFSFSRSAWIGTAAAVVLTAWLGLKSVKARRYLGWAFAAVLVVAIILVAALRDNLTFQNYLFHTDKASKIVSTSDQGHSAAFKSAVKDIAHRPLGGGTGTAGPQSAYNDHPARIAENYYLQIGQEAGIIGMVLFIAICTVVGRMLYARRADPLALAMFASLIGISIVGLLSHVWSDDTLAYIWWGLAAAALSPIMMDKHKLQNGQKIKNPPQRSRPIR